MRIFAVEARLLQVFIRDADSWKIAAYHNTDIKPTVRFPEPA
jgi:hypothetical protein